MTQKNNSVTSSPHFLGLSADGMGGGMTFSMVGAPYLLERGESIGFFS